MGYTGLQSVQGWFRQVSQSKFRNGKQFMISTRASESDVNLMHFHIYLKKINENFEKIKRTIRASRQYRLQKTANIVNLSICIQNADINNQLKKIAQIYFLSKCIIFIRPSRDRPYYVIGCGGRRAGVHSGFRTITLVLYIGSLPNLAT